METGEDRQALSERDKMIQRDKMILAMCRQFGMNWWTRFVSEQQMQQLLRDPARREAICDDAVGIGVDYAFGCIHAGIVAGLVKAA